MNINMSMKIYPKRFLVLLAISLFSALPGQSGNGENGYPRISNYSPKDYRADTQNWAVVQDKRGVMYFGNNTGLLEYDGENWRLYPMQKNTTVRTLSIDEEGRIFAGGIGDLGYYFADSLGALTFHSLLPYIPQSYLDFSDVWQVIVSHGKAYFNVDKYILIWDIKATKFTAIKGDDNFHLIFVVNGNLYAREWAKGLQVLKGDSLVLVNGGAQFADKKIYAMLPLPGENGKLLIATRNYGMFIYDGIHFSPFKTEVDAFIKKNLLYYPGIVLNDGNILLGTLNDGVVIIDPGGKIIQIFDHQSGIINPIIYAQMQDRDGAIWLSTDNGISRIDYGSPVSYFDSRNQFSSIAYQLTRYKGVLYAATTNGVYYLDKKNRSMHQFKNSRNQTVTFLKYDEDLLVGTLDGLFKIENFLTQPIRLSEGSEYDVNALVRSTQDPNRVYVGALGLWSLYKTPGGWKDEGQILQIEDIISSIEEDDNGDLWAGTNTLGVFKITPRRDSRGRITLKNPEIVNYNHQNGLPGGMIAVKKIDGENYFLSVDHFYRFNKREQQFYQDNTFKVVPSLPNYISPENIVKDQDQNLWISLGREPARGTRGADGGYRWLKAPFKRFSNEIIISIYPENDGVVWFTTGSSIIKYDLNVEKKAAIDYPVLIRRVDIDVDSTLYWGGRAATIKTPLIEFAYNAIKFTFAAPSFEDESANLYKTYLKGYDAQWSSWEKEDMREYTNLGPGNYTFNVIAKNISGVESRPASYVFEILPPWYRTWPSYVLYVLILAGGIFLVDRFQRKRLLAREMEKMKMQAAEFRAETAELQSKAAEAERRALEIENNRKSKELEEARQLQLSMLPKEIPDLPHVQIAVFMKTATEVGGDYYDFSLHENGSLNIGFGDATGHGMKAGIMVSSMKSIFTTNAAKMKIDQFFRTANSGIKAMQLKRMMMGFTMLNIDKNKLKLINAGMPPVFLFRDQSQTVEEISEHGMPVGAMRISRYNTIKKKLNKGDVIFVLSDGLPELQNEGGEMFGYARITAHFKQVASKSPEEIIEHLKNAGSQWVHDADPDDDVTFVVIKMS